MPLAAGNFHIQDKPHNTCSGLGVEAHIHMPHILVHIHTELDQADPKLMYQLALLIFKHRGTTCTKETSDKRHDYRYETCLLEGLPPHESRMYCPPNWVPFNIDKACSSQALKNII